MDCDGDPGNGCETDVLSSPTACGDCRVVCSSAGGTPSCAQGKCGIECGAHRADCNNDVTDGCEADLTADDAHCGTCANSCGATASCVDGKCGAQVFQSGLATPYGLAIDGGYLYWVEFGTVAANYVDGRLARAPLAGGAIEVLAAGLLGPGALVVDASFVYVATLGTLPDQLDGAVLRVPKAGGAPEVLASLPGATSLAADATTLYVGGAGKQGTMTAFVASVPKAGGNPTMLVPGLGSVLGVTVDADRVYFTDHLLDKAGIVPKAGGAPTLLTSALGPYGVAIDATTGYVSSSTKLVAVPLAGGPPVKLVINGNQIANVLRDGGFVYYTDFINTSLSRVPAGGGAPVELANGLDAPFGMAADATYLYVTELGQSQHGGTIRRVVK